MPPVGVDLELRDVPVLDLGVWWVACEGDVEALYCVLFNVSFRR